jgi:bifunctional enzyme CysN/CysC
MSAQRQRLAACASSTAGPAAVPGPQRDLVGQVRVLTCGSVDDGKSTLIGRLLWDASDLFEDQRESLRKSARRVLDGTHLDYSLLVDGLLVEREQGITIDIAWRYFDTAARRFTIIDSPGHEQYTRNMASGASHADVAVMVIDARHGIKSQTKRHAALLDLFGVRRVILAVNKMDLVDWSETRFREIEADFKSLVWRFRFEATAAIPVAAVTGDNIARPSAAMTWYSGPTLLERLNSSQPVQHDSAAPFRMPVQMVLRDGQDFRGLAGTVTSGHVVVGDALTDVVGKVSATVTRISTMDGDLITAKRGQAIALVLDRDIDVSRGAVMASPEAPPVVARSVEAHLVWLSETAFDAKGRYLLRTATDLLPIANTEVRSLLDLETLVQKPTTKCEVNDIAVATISFTRPIAVDPFSACPETGNFVLIDPITGATVAGGVITATSTVPVPLQVQTAPSIPAFKLTRQILASGICADLAGLNANDLEFARRADAVADILRAAGVVVLRVNDDDTCKQRWMPCGMIF